MTRAEVREAVVAANRFDVVHSTFAAKIARGSEINLKRFGAFGGCRSQIAANSTSPGAIKIRNGSPRHFDIVTAKKEQETVTRQTNNVRNENKLDSSFRPKLQTLEQTTAEKNAYAGTRNGDRTGKYTRLTLSQTELRLQILGQKHHES